MACAILTVPPLIVATVLAAVAAADNLHYYLDHPGYFDDTNDYGYGPQVIYYSELSSKISIDYNRLDNKIHFCGYCFSCLYIIFRCVRCFIF